MNDKKQKTGANASPRQQARIAAVQAIFQQNFNKLAFSQILIDFRESFLKVNTDENLFANLVKAALDRLEQADSIIAENLSEGWMIERIDPVLRAILRVGIAELMALPEIPARVVVSEYVGVAHVFLDDKEAGMVNGLLDKVARLIRSGEFS